MINPPFKTGDRVVYNMKELPHAHYDFYSAIMVVFGCTHDNVEKDWMVQTSLGGSWDWGSNLRRLTPLEELL